MPGKRDHVAEILAARARGRGHDLIVHARLPALTHKAKEPSATAYVDYFPVAAIAALESVFRVAIRDLVDFGPPYSDRAGKVVHDVKVEVPALHSFHGRQISVGEFVAHLVPFKSFKDIDRALTALLDTSFISAIKVVEDPWARRVEGQKDARVLPSHGPVFEDVKALISIRHQLAHEVSHSPPVSDVAVLRRQLASTERFARGITEVVSQALHPNAPLTQAEMDEAAKRDALEADATMNHAYNTGLEGMVGDERKAFEASQRAFLEYRDSLSTFAGTRVAGGSMRPMVESLECARLTRQRTDDLRWVLKSWEESAGL